MVCAARSYTLVSCLPSRNLEWQPSPYDAVGAFSDNILNVVLL